MGLVVPALGPGLALDRALAPKAVLATAAATNLDLKANPDPEANHAANHRTEKPIASDPKVGLDLPTGNAKTATGRSPPLRPTKKSHDPDLDPAQDPLRHVKKI